MPVNSPGTSRMALNVAAVSSTSLGLGFGIPCAIGLRHFATTGKIWVFMGYPTYGHGPFERAGIRTSVPLLGMFLAVCGAEVAAGWLLIRSPKAGRRLALALLAAEIPFWAGFALPLAPPLALLRTMAVLRSRATG